MIQRSLPFVHAGVSNERLIMVFNLTILPTSVLAPYGVLTVYGMDTDLISTNYATKTISATQNLKFMSRNSPCVLEGGRVYLHGAFPEFNLKPHVFHVEHLLSWVPGFPQVDPCMKALDEELKTLDHWLMAGHYNMSAIQ